MTHDEQRHYAKVLIRMGLRDLARFKRELSGRGSSEHLAAMHHYNIGRIGLAAALELITAAEDERFTDLAGWILHAPVKRAWRPQVKAVATAEAAHAE